MLHYKSCVCNGYLGVVWGTARCGRQSSKLLQCPHHRNSCAPLSLPSPPIEQSRCSILPFERCKATHRSLLEHLVDRSTQLSSPHYPWFQSNLLRTALPFASLLPKSESPLIRLLVIPSCFTAAVCPYRPRSVWVYSPSPCAAFICTCEEQRTKSGRLSTDLNTFYIRVIDSLTLRRLPSLFLSSLPGLENRTNDVFFSWVLAGVSQS